MADSMGASLRCGECAGGGHVSSYGTFGEDFEGEQECRNCNGTGIEPISFDLIYDLHCLVGIDAVSEFRDTLKEFYPDRLEEFDRKLQEYYDSKYWHKYYTE